jgi:sugar phosphate isomerase/epimerase
MDLSFSTTAGAEDSWSLHDCLEWAAAHQFDAVRLRNTGVCDPERILTDGPDEVLEMLRRHDLYLAALWAPQSRGGLLHADPEQRQRNLEALLRSLEAAARLHAPVVVLNTGSPIEPFPWLFYGMPSHPPGNPTDRTAEVIELFKQQFTPIVQRAEELGLRIALDTAVRMGNIACNPEMWERCLDAVPSDALGLSCDPSHLLWLHITPVEDAIRMFAGKWYYADVKDCEIMPQQLFRQGIIGNWWWQYRVPGRGQLNWGTIIAALIESGYNYVLCIENEDRSCPGLAGIALGRRYLAQFLT